MPKPERSTATAVPFPELVADFRVQLHELADRLAEAVEAADVELLNVEHNRLEWLLIEARTALGTNMKDKRDPKVWRARFAALDLHAAAAIVEGGGDLPAQVAEALPVLTGDRQTDGRSHESDRAAVLLRLLDRGRDRVRERGKGAAPTEADAAFVASAYVENFPAAPDVARVQSAQPAIMEYLRVVTTPVTRGAGSAELRKGRAQTALTAVHRAFGLAPKSLDSLKRQTRRKSKGGQ